MVPNQTVYDERLSYMALGVLCVLLARPPKAGQGYRALMGRGSGQTALLSALKELTNAGYRHQVKVREDGGRILTHTVVSENPISPDEASQWLKEVLDRASHIHARSDLRIHTVSAGGAVRGSPGPGAPSHGEAMHLPTEAKVLSLRSRTGKTNGSTKPPNFDELVEKARREKQKESGP